MTESYRVGDAVQYQELSTQVWRDSVITRVLQTGERYKVRAWHGEAELLRSHFSLAAPGTHVVNDVAGVVRAEWRKRGVDLSEATLAYLVENEVRPVDEYSADQIREAFDAGYRTALAEIRLERGGS